MVGSITSGVPLGTGVWPGQRGRVAGRQQDTRHKHTHQHSPYKRFDEYMMKSK